MIDFYDELDIAQSLGLKEIKQALVRLSKAYEKREADGFETAREKLVLISKAEVVFKTENTRKQYDRELADSKGESNKAVDPMEERKAQYRQWFSKAAEYRQSGQYDAAKKAIDRAFRNVSLNDDDAELYSLAADIYRQNGELKGALDHVVEALILDESNVINHLNKFLIYQDLFNSNISDRNNYNVQKQREILEMAERLAKKDDNTAIIAQVYDFLAYSWYENGHGDASKAMSYAVSAIQMMPDAANAKMVLESIERTRNLEAERERQRLEAEKNQKKQQCEIEEMRQKQQLINEIVRLEQLNKTRYFSAPAFFKDMFWITDELWFNLINTLYVVGFFALWVRTTINPFFWQWANPLLLLLGALLIVLTLGYGFYAGNGADGVGHGGIHGFWIGFRLCVIGTLGIIALFGSTAPFLVAMPIYFITGVVTGFIKKND